MVLCCRCPCLQRIRGDGPLLTRASCSTKQQMRCAISESAVLACLSLACNYRSCTGTLMICVHNCRIREASAWHVLHTLTLRSPTHLQRHRHAHHLSLGTHVRHGDVQSPLWLKLLPGDSRLAQMMPQPAHSRTQAPPAMAWQPHAIPAMACAGSPVEQPHIFGPL